MTHQFKPQDYFDLKDVSFADIFDNKEYVWDAIKDISSYLKELFKTGKLKGNYSDNVFVDPTASVDPTVRMIGPAFIGKNSRVGFNTFLRENVIIGENSIIGFSCEVKNSVILNNSAIAHLNYVGDSIIGNDVNLSGGAILANFRLDQRPVTIKIEDQVIETGLLKFGSIVGDGTRIGVNSVGNPGTILGKNCAVYPLKVLTGIYPDNSIVK